MDLQSIAFFPAGKDRSAGWIQFKFPNIWMLTIIPGKFAQVIAFVPVNENQTRMYLRGYQNFCNLPVIAGLINLIVNWQNRIILNQDKRVVLSQTPSSSLMPQRESLFRSDRGIKHFRDRWRILSDENQLQ